MTNYLKFIQIIILIGMIGVIADIKLTSTVNIDNSYFTNKIIELEKENKDLKENYKILSENRDEDEQFINERCACKPYFSGDYEPMTKKQICNTPDDQLYFYRNK